MDGSLPRRKRGPTAFAMGATSHGSGEIGFPAPDGTVTNAAPHGPMDIRVPMAGHPAHGHRSHEEEAGSRLSLHQG